MQTLVQDVLVENEDDGETSCQKIKVINTSHISKSDIFVTHYTPMKTNKKISSLAALAALAALAPITGHDGWLSFLSFLSFLAFSKVTRDERFKANRDRAARNGFVVAVVALSSLVPLLGNHASHGVLLMAVELGIILSTLAFALSYTWYDKKGY